jgi:hypothetical protein
MFGSEANVMMLDDGLHADGVAGDGVYGAMVPHTSFTHGEMVRYYITATATNNSLTRQPPFPHPTFSAQYFGAVVQNPTLTNPLPVLHLFAPAATITSAGNDPNARFQCSLYWLGEFYDNVGFNRHGQSSGGFPKKSYDIDFNADHHFKPSPDLPRVDDINLLTTYPDKAHMRNHLSYGVYRDAGSPYHYVVSVRVQTNGGFYGDWHIVENGDADFLDRIGRDRNGALYKMYAPSPASGTRPSEGSERGRRRASTKAMPTGRAVQRRGHEDSPDRQRFIDNINVPEVVNMMAARVVTGDIDCCHKNYYFYRDSDGTGEWEAFPWDVDLAFGRNWQSGETYWDDRVYPRNGLFVGNNNSFFQLVFTAGSAPGRCICGVSARSWTNCTNQWHAGRTAQVREANQ